MEESRSTKRWSRSFEDPGRGDYLEEVGKGRVYHGTWCLPRGGSNRDADERVELALPCGCTK